MPLEYELWRMDGAPVRIATRPGSLEPRLEELIEADPGLYGRPLLVLGRHVPTTRGGFCDLLAMDSEGNLRVMKLALDPTPRNTVSQILNDGAWARHLTNLRIREIHAAHARSRGLPEELDEAFALRFGRNTPRTLNAERSLTIVRATTTRRPSRPSPSSPPSSGYRSTCSSSAPSRTRAAPTWRTPG